MRIGILGAGRMGTCHAQAYQKLEEVEIVGIVGRTPDKVKKVSTELGIPGFTDPEQVLNDGSVDAVDIALPSAVHREFAVRALEAGKHVFCETPMVLTLEDADAIILAQQASKRIFGVALLMRFVADYDFIFDALNSGRAGAPIAAVGCRLSPPYSTGAEGEHYGDPIIELMLFELDVLVRLFGTPKSVTASSTGHPSLGHVLATFAWDGFHANLEATNQMPTSYPFTTGFRLTCERETIVSEFTMRNGEFGGGLFRYPPSGEPEKVQIGHDPYLKECEYFVKCVNGKVDPEFISAREARRSLDLSFRVQESLANSGQPVIIAENEE